MTTVRVALSGPYELSAATIDSVITKTSPGMYVLAPSGSNIAKRIGRSDFDLNSRLKTYIGQYGKFWYAYASSPKDAFEKECYLWHDLKPSDNTYHPDRPNGSMWKCPVCRNFG